MEFSDTNNEQRKDEDETRAESYDIFYVCRGSCGAKMNEEEYKQDKTKKCGDSSCPYYDMPFERVEIPKKQY